MKYLNKPAFLKFSHNWLNTDKKAYLGYFIAGLVCIASLFLAGGVSSGRFNPVLVLVVLGVVIGLTFLVRWPFIGNIGILLGGMFLPFSWQGGFNISQIGLVAMLGLWFIDVLVIKKRIDFIKSRTLLPAFLFILISILSFSLGQFSWYPFARNAPIEAQFGGLMINLLSIGAFLLVAHQIDTLFKLEFLTWTFFIFGGIYVLGRFLELGWIDNLYQSGFKAGALFWTWFMALLAGQVFADRKYKILKRLFLAGILVIALYVAIIQTYDWKSGWFPPLVAVAVVIGIRYWRIARYFLIFAIIPFFFLITTSVGNEDWSWGTRMDAWIIVLNIALISPILGMGFANYYWYTPLFLLRGFAARFNSHSQYVDLIAQTGVLGLVCFFWIFTEIGLLGLRLIRKIPDGFGMGYVYGALGGLAGTLVAGYLVDWVLPFAYNIGLTGFRASILGWIFMGGIVSIEQIFRKQGIQERGQL